MKFLNAFIKLYSASLNVVEAFWSNLYFTIIPIAQVGYEMVL